MTEETSDQLLAAAKDHGLVPRGCRLDGLLVLAEVWQDRDPCGGCNVPRAQCGGRPKKEGDTP